MNMKRDDFRTKVTYIILLLITISECYVNYKETDKLIELFLTNLKEDPKVKGGLFKEQVKEFIDKQSENYINLIKEKNNANNHLLTKRSAPTIDTMDKLIKDDMGVYVLEGFLPIHKIGAQHPNDIQLFKHEKSGVEDWFAISLEEKGDRLVIYKFNGAGFIKTAEKSIHNGYRLAIQTVPLFSIIVLIKKDETSDCDKNSPEVFIFNLDQQLHKIQSLNSQCASDLSFWVQDSDLFLAISHEKSFNENEKEYNFEVESPVYHWKGGHFDLVQKIKTFNALKILPFSAKNSHFLIVANRNDNRGDKNIFSEILKYDPHLSQYILHQRILTNGVKDIKHFCFSEGKIKEDFLIVVNSNRTDESRGTNSLILKYVDEYYLPFQNIDDLNGIDEWLPLAGENGSFALLAINKDECIRAFQYNGWNFEDTEIEYSGGALKKGIKSVSAYIVDKKPIIVVANENDNGEMMNLFEPIFSHKNMLNDFHNEMLRWCESNLKYLKEDGKMYLKRHTEDFDGLHHMKTIRRSRLESFNEKQRKVNNNLEILDRLENIVDNALRVTRENSISSRLIAEKITLLKESNFFQSLTAGTINNVDVFNLLKTVIPLENDFNVGGSLQLKNIQIDNPIEPKFINNHPVKELMSASNDNFIRNLTIIGNAFFDSGLEINGLLNGLKFDEDNILLTEKDQIFNGYLELDKLVVKNVNVGFINDINVAKIDSFHRKLEFHVKNLTVDGLINNINLQEVYENALKVSGNQEVNGPYSFKHIFIDNLETKQIGNIKIPEDLLVVNGGDQEMNNEIQFFNNLVIKNLVINNNLNNILVFDGNLDVVLADIKEEQRISGNKIFENIELLHPMELRGQIDNKNLANINPVIRTEKELILEDDYVITGNVTIENFLKADDVFANDENLSLQHLINKGIKIKAQKMPVHINFKQAITVNELFVDKINGLYISSLVLKTSAEPQVLTGWKRINSDIIFAGNVSLINVNGINLQNFENDVFRTSGNQVIDGNHFIKSITANRVNSNKTYLAGRPFEVSLNEELRNIEKTLLINSSVVKINNLKATHLFIQNGRLNGYNFDEIVKDTVYFDQPVNIIGHKIFKFLNVRELFSADGMDKTIIPDMIEQANSLYIISDDTHIPVLSVDKLLVRKTFNNIPIEKLERMPFEKPKILVYGDVKINQLTVFGKAFVENDRINNISVTGMLKNSVKIDEPHTFPAVYFANGIESKQQVTLNGEFLGINLLDLVQSENVKDIFMKEKRFYNDVFVHGKLYFDGIVSGVNMSNLCEYLQLPIAKYNKDIVVEGNAYFLRAPQINYVNNAHLHTLKENLHVPHKRSNPIATSAFESIVFEGDVIVNHFLTNLNLDYIAQWYFSKTKDQFVSANISFSDDIVFEKDVLVREAIVLDKLYDINLREFKETVLLNGETQLFAMPLAVKTCTINAINGDEYTINGNNIETDILRYDKPNYVIGKKNLNNLKARMVKIDKPINIQGVNILPWLQESVLKKGTFKIKGKKYFKNNVGFSNGVSAHNVNGMPFNKESILTKSTPHVVTGRKVFSESNNDLIFRNLHLKGTWNTKDLREILDNKAYKSSNLQFHSPIHFHGPIKAKNIKMKSYQGLDINQFIQNVTSFSKTVSDEQCDQLHTTSLTVQKSLSHQAYYLNYFKVIKVFYDTEQAFPIKTSSNEYIIAVVNKKSKNVTITLYEWNDNDKLFNKELGEVKLNKPVTYIKSLQFNNETKIYMELNEVGNELSDETQERNLYTLNNTRTFDFLYKIVDANILDIKPVALLGIKDICMMVLRTTKMSMYCENTTEFDSLLTLHYEIEIAGLLEAEVLNFNNYDIVIALRSERYQEEQEFQIEVFKSEGKNFIATQRFYVVEPSSISAIRYKDVYYLAVVSQQVQDAQFSGTVHIRRFNKETLQFEKYQDIQLQSPFHLKFAILPSQELVLYVLTKTPTQPLIVFIYEGIVGFQESIIASTIPTLKVIDCFSSFDKHFIFAQSDKNTILMEAFFIGANNTYG